MDANVTAQCELQAEIKKFSDIIDSNNTALGAIAQLQQHLHEHGRIEVPFMVRKTTCILVETFKMIKRINELCGNRYSNLFDVYEDIASAIKTKLGEGPGHRDRKTVEKLVIPFSDIDGSHADAVGGKISFLCDIRNRTGVPVPDGFAITEGAYRLFVERNSLGERIRSMIAADRQSGDGALPAGLTDIEALYRASSEIQQMIISSSLPDELNKAIRDAVKVLKAHSPPDLRLAVRSSALFESNSFTSFAGQYRSVLNIPEDEVNSAYLRVVASKFTPEAMVYASAHGYEIADLSMCAGVQRMIDARSSGIMYTYTEGWPMVMIQSVYGLGLYIVNGSLVPDTYVYDCTSHRISSVTTGEKSVMLTCDRYGTKEERVGEHDRARPSLDNDQAVLLASIGERLGKRYKSSLDIEWAIDSRSNIHILQCRYLPSAPCRDARDREGYDFDIEWAVDENGEPYVLEYVQKNRKRFSLGMAIPQRQIPNRIIVGGGATASPGAIAGKAFHVDSDLEIMRFPAGAIAIAKTANPRLAVLLKKAAGIVSEKGDIAGHLATVARETDIPALFGTGNADIPDGTDITLDATHKKVYEGTVRELASSRRDDRKMSPSGLLLQSLLQDIAVLNMPSPLNSNAQALKCRTIHDIVRFVHQTAIEEMFKICDTRVSKGCRTRIIVSPIPIELIAFDLGDGIAEGAPEGNVPIGYIESIPMKALWSGMMHKGIKWSGERGINVSGLISAMTNYMVDEGISVRGLGAPSYVFISRNYLNFNSRVGYHFATVDALVTEESESNYVNFRFSGGANALDRRSRRATLIEKILGDAGFTSTRTMDTIDSRIQNLGEEEMKLKIECLGRLLGFVNRLDIAMVTDNDIERYYTAFREQRYGVL